MLPARFRSLGRLSRFRFLIPSSLVRFSFLSRFLRFFSSRFFFCFPPSFLPKTDLSHSYSSAPAVGLGLPPGPPTLRRGHALPAGLFALLAA